MGDRRAGIGRGVALALIGAALLAPEAADASEAIGRRLAALRGLVTPGVTPTAPARTPDAGSGGCAGGWWRSSEYALRARIDAAVRDASLRYRVDAGLLRAVIRQESNYDPDAVSRAGAMGLMQLMPGTARRLGVVCPFEPRENILAGTRYLRQMHARFGRWADALAAYNAGPGRIAAGRIPGETRNYVRRILSRWRPHLLAGTRYD